MHARYSRFEIDLSPEGLQVRAAARNRSSTAWDSASGDYFSFQIYDAETEALLVDGSRAALPAPVRPGDETAIDLTIPIPVEPGRFLVFVSGVREGEAWFFERGSEFLLAEVERGAEGGLTILRRSRTTLRGLARRRLVRSIGRAFTYPVRTIARNRSLIRSLVRRDIAGRYAGSYGGTFWTVIHPLMMMLTYWFVFGMVLQTRFGADGRPSNFVLYFLAGMLPWLAFSEAAGRAPSVILEHSNFVKKLVFPVEILPVKLTFAGLFGEVFGVGIFLCAMLLFGRDPQATALLLPLILIPQILFTMGVCWFLAALGVFFRDLGQLIGFLLTVWFFTTPICYPEASLPQGFVWLFKLNPMYVLVRAYRAVLIEGTPPEPAPLAVLTGVSGLAFLIGHAWFYKLKRSFADLV